MEQADHGNELLPIHQPNRKDPPMEQYSMPHQRVREKSVYLLHLDAARIVLISAGVVGIIVVSFLLGMNFTKGGGRAAPAAENELFGGHKNADLLKNLPDGNMDDDLSKPLDETIIPGEKDSVLPAPDKESGRMEKQTGAMKKAPEEHAINEASDPSAESAVETQESKSLSKNKEPLRMETKKTAKRSDDHENAIRPAKKSETPAHKKKKSGRVMEVSGSQHHPAAKDGIARYAIQVASYDSRAKAESEARALRDLRYDAYVDETHFKGRPFYRVRIGQISSRKSAIDLLQSIQERDRYRESYIVRE